MSNRDPKFDAYVVEIHKVLHRLDYYKLLGVSHTAGVSDIRKAFMAIAAKFHPDRNRNASAQVQKALYDIFKRLNEAYRVLCIPGQRQAYNKELATGKMRLDNSTRKKSGPENPEDTIKNRQARQFYREAVEELKNGNLMKAELHCKVAQSRERDNEAIENLVAKINTAKQNKKK
jgi:DnaJ-class molecular chaperone